MAADLVVPSDRRTFTAMGCSAHAVVVAEQPEPLLGLVGRRLDELERRWSRFLPDSEISGLNAAAGQPRRVSSDTVRLVEALVQAWHATDGAFDPTLLGALVGLGYAQSRSDATLRTSLAADVRPSGRPDRILLEAAHRIVQLPAGTAIDAGGMGKGLAADLIVDELLAAGAHGALVEIGGDLRVAGTSPDDGGWPIDVRSAVGADDVRVTLSAGGVATSSSRLRTWTDAATGIERHHLVDPRTLQSTGEDVVGCTVIAGSAAWAEAFTKVAFVDGASAAIDRYDRFGLAARVTTETGTIHHSTAWGAFLR